MRVVFTIGTRPKGIVVTRIFKWYLGPSNLLANCPESNDRFCLWSFTIMLESALPKLAWVVLIIPILNKMEVTNTIGRNGGFHDA